MFLQENNTSVMLDFYVDVWVIFPWFAARHFLFLFTIKWRKYVLYMGGYKSWIIIQYQKTSAYIIKKQ